MQNSRVNTDKVNDPGRKNFLPNDVCRCHDEDCPLSGTCRRFLNRNTGGVRTPMVKTFRKEGEAECKGFMDVNK